MMHLYAVGMCYCATFSNPLENLKKSLGTKISATANFFFGVYSIYERVFVRGSSILGGGGSEEHVFQISVSCWHFKESFT